MVFTIIEKPTGGFSSHAAYAIVQVFLEVCAIFLESHSGNRGMFSKSKTKEHVTISVLFLL